MALKTIRVADSSDYTDIACLLAEGFPHDARDVWMRRFDMWWDNNPSSPRGLPRGWILENDDDEMTGFFGIIPVDFWINGERGTALAGTSWYVRPQERGVPSILLIKEMLKLRIYPVFINNTPNDISKEVFTKLHFHMNRIPYNHTEYWYIFNCSNVLELMKTQGIYSRIHRIRMILRPFLRAAVPLINDRSRRLLHAGTRNDPVRAHYRCRRCDVCDDRFTELWDAAKDTRIISLYRDARILNWLCFSDPVRDKRTMIECTDASDGSLKGYCIVDIISFLDGGVRIMQQKDIFLPDYDEAAHRAMVRYVLQFAGSAGVDAVYFWALHEPMNALLHRLFPIYRKNSNPYLYRINVPVPEDCRYMLSSLDPDCGAI